ncbi:putative disease resistance protein RGA4 [Carex rostrata]
MADLLLSALLPIVVQKSADILVQRIGEMWGVADQREKLHNKLLAVQAVLTDAEEKGDDNRYVKTWLVKLKSAAYYADDVLDEIHYEELRWDAVRRGHKVKNVSGFFSLRNPILFRFNMSRKLKEAVGRIHGLVTEMETFKFVQGRQGRVVDHVRTDSYVIESEVLGRRDDKEKLVKLLTEAHPTENLMVLPVVGMGGLGKTTLAQLVYNDPKVKEYFNLQLWICVSEEFNTGRLVKLIIELVNGECKHSIENMELLKKSLREILSGKRYVLVLDDVWNENVNEWEHLRALLDCGDSGSVVIVTTRNDRVAQIMGTIESYNLECLDEEDSWSLFQKRAFSKGVKEHPELVEIGKKLVQKCGGLPLAIKALGSLLSYKHEVQEWSAVLQQSTIWEHKHANEVFPALRISYNHLPSYMKQCFAFCAVFPKDHVMKKETLVQYWMANGFIPSDKSGDLEMTGSDIFNELVWRSFFQDVEQVFCEPYRWGHGYLSQTTCKMHDLMHDLAQSVMRDECLSLLEPLQTLQQKKLSETGFPVSESLSAGHQSSSTTTGKKVKLGSCYAYTQELKTLECKNKSKLVSTLKFLVVREISYLFIFLRKKIFCDRRHNRSLIPVAENPFCCSEINNNFQCNMRHISLRKFPKDINDVIQCYPTARNLISNSIFPNHVQKIGFVKSNFLRVFDLSKCVLSKDTMITPGKMKHLRYLDLWNQSMEAIPEAITTLYLLQVLRLSDWPCLSELPEGMRYMMSLRHLHIENCDGLKCTPPGLGELKYLQTLTYYIVGTRDGNKFGELKTLNIGGQLEVYNLGEVGNAREAREVNMESKQNLDHLVLSWGMPNRVSEGVRSNSSLAVVVDLEVLTALKPCNKLKVLKIEKYRGDKFPIWMNEYQMLENLVELYIVECRRCINLPPLHRLPLLQILKIDHMDNLRHFCCGVLMNVEGGDDAPKTFPSLKSLYLYNMPNLDCWCEGDVGENTSLIFPVLSELSITDCPKLNTIPITPKLEEMIIVGNNTLSSLATGITNVRRLTLESRGGRENIVEETLSFKPWESLSLNPWVSLEELTIMGFNHIIPPKDERECGKLSVDVNATALRNLRIYSSNFWFSSIPSNSPLWLWKCFTFIESLYIRDCDSLTSWPEEELSNLNCLRIMEVWHCKNFLQSRSESPPKMSYQKMLLPKLESLEIENCPNMVEVPELPRSLEKLEISGSEKLENLPEWFGNLVALKELKISYCESLNSFPSSIGGLTALQVLGIYSCKSLESLPEQLGSLVALRKLVIFSCESLNSLPSSIGGLTALEILGIYDCMNLSSLPEGMQGLEALKTLEILSCPKLMILPEGLLQRLSSLHK